MESLAIPSHPDPLKRNRSLTRFATLAGAPACYCCITARFRRSPGCGRFA
jgi:hypothetical protein